MLLQVFSFIHSRLWGEDNWLRDEAVLEPLHLSDHLRLLIWGAVMMYYTETSEKSHVDGHLVLGHGVHRRGEQWGLQRDSLRYGRIEGDC